MAGIHPIRLWIMPWLHLPWSSYDLFVYDFLHDFFGIVGGYKLPQGYLTIIVLSSRPPYINCMMQVRWPCGSRKESVRWLCNCHVIMCMDLNGHPCLFFDTHLNCVSKSCDHKSCYDEASVFSWTWLQGRGLRVTFVYILMSIFKFFSFHRV